MADYPRIIISLIEKFESDKKALKNENTRIIATVNDNNDKFEKHLKLYKDEAEEVCDTVLAAYSKLVSTDVPKVWSMCVRDGRLNLDEYVSKNYVKKEIKVEELSEYYELIMRNMDEISYALKTVSGILNITYEQAKPYYTIIGNALIAIKNIKEIIREAAADFIAFVTKTLKEKFLLQNPPLLAQIDENNKKIDDLYKATSEQIKANIISQNKEMSFLNLSNSKTMALDFDSDYTLKLMGKPAPSINEVNEKVKAFNSAITEKLTNMDVRELNLNRPELARIVFDGNDTKKAMALYERIVYEFLLSYPSKFKNVVAIHHQSGSPFFEFMSKVASVKKGAFLFPGNPSTVFTTSEEINQILNDLIKKINQTSEKLGSGGYKDVLDYNSKNPDNPEPLILFIAHDCPNGFDSQNLIDCLMNIIDSGPRCGIIPIINVNKAHFEEDMRSSLMEEIKKDLNGIKGQRYNLTDYAPLPYAPDFKLNDFFAYLEKELKIADRPIMLGDVIPNENFATSIRRKEFSKILRIPIGKASGKIQEIVLDANGKSHVIIEGGSGSGKTVFARTMILSACSLYSPDELQIQLFDFKDGMGFKSFSDYELKHLKFVSFNNKIDDARDVLTYISSLIGERNRQITSISGIDTLEGYNKKALEEGTKPIPRMMVVLDEYQEIVELDECLKSLEDIARRGRACGISLILSSQDVPKKGDFNKIKQLLDHRFVFQSSPENIASLIPAMEKRGAELALIKGTAAYDENLNRPIIFRSAYSGNDSEVPAVIRKINDKYPTFTAEIKRVGEVTPLVVSNVKEEIVSPSRRELEKDYIDNGAINLSLGQYNISEENFYIKQDENNSVLFIIGDYVRSKNIITSMLISQMRALHASGIETPSSNLMVIDLCEFARKIRKENPLTNLLMKKQELEENGDNRLSYFDYYASSQLDELLAKLDEIIKRREGDFNERDPMVVTFIAVEGFSFGPRQLDTISSLVNKGRRMDIYFVFQMEKINNELYRQVFKSTRNNNSNLAKDFIILSDGDIYFDGDTFTCEVETSLTAKEVLDNLSGLISSGVITTYNRSLDKNPLNPSFAFIVDDGVISKFKFFYYDKDYVNSFVEEMK